MLTLACQERAGEVFTLDGWFLITAWLAVCVCVTLVCVHRLLTVCKTSLDTVWIEKQKNLSYLN